MLVLKDITYQPQTGNKKIFNNLNFTLNENEVITITGKSGSGKTTLLELISGLIKAQKGKIYWRNKIINPRQRRWLCGVVFQFPERFFIGATIGKELKTGHKNLNNEEIEKVLKKVGLSKVSLTMPPENLSGGQQRRLAVATQLLRKPKILLLDEPTAGLDWSMKNDVRKLIDELRKNNTIIIVTHEPKLFDKLSSNILSIKKGRIDSLKVQNIGR